jgi:trimeric autotransporter adhesin
MSLVIGQGIGSPFVFRATASLPLESLSATAAYSLRRTRLGYTGALVRVRRSSDNLEADIGYTAFGDLDTAALLAHTGANSGFIVTWYDQSGNARHATQSTAAVQPRIVNAGAVETKNGRPAIRSHINTAMLPAWKFAAPSTAFSFNAVASRDTAGVNSNDALGLDGTGFNTDGLIVQISNTGFRGLYCRTGVTTDVPSASVTIASGQNIVGTLTHTAGNSAQTFANGSGGTPTAITWTNGVLTAFRLGEYPGIPSISLLGTYQEILSFASVLTTGERQSLERNQGAYFGVAVA